MTASRTANRFRVLLALAASVVVLAFLAQPASAATRPAVLLPAAPTGPALLAPAAAPAATRPAAHKSVVVAPQPVQVIRPWEPIGQQWGEYADAAITRAISQDNGTGTPFADSWLASGIAQRSALGWDDPVALHYLHAALDQATPYGLGYAYDAFQNGTVNPASTIYAITLSQVGWVELDAWKAGQIPESDIDDVIAKLLVHPRIPVTPGIGLAYSNDPNDVLAGYTVHNVNQAAALFLQDCLDAGIAPNQPAMQAMIDGLNAFELASYNPKINGWTYRNGGPTTVQDPGHGGVGAWWALRFYPRIGAVNTRYLETTDYGYVNGSWVHSGLAQWDCADSRPWLGQFGQYLSDPATSDFLSAAKATRMMAQSAAACGGPAAASTFSMPTTGGQASVQRVAPDTVG